MINWGPHKDINHVTRQVEMEVVGQEEVRRRRRVRSKGIYAVHHASQAVPSTDPLPVTGHLFSDQTSRLPFRAHFSPGARLFALFVVRNLVKPVVHGSFLFLNHKKSSKVRRHLEISDSIFQMPVGELS
jgi:hypothetical protein